MWIYNPFAKYGVFISVLAVLSESIFTILDLNIYKFGNCYRHTLQWVLQVLDGLK